MALNAMSVSGLRGVEFRTPGRERNQSSGGWRASLALALLAACAEEEPPAATGCGSDVDCAAGRVCVGGGCVEPAPACTSDAACPVDELCDAGACVPRTERVACTHFGDPSCEPDEVCTLSSAGSCPAPPCPARLECQPPIGATEPLYACATDDECSTARCLDGMCLHPCGGLVDCPGGFGCEELTLGARTLGRCIPVEQNAADFGATRCDRPQDCPPDRSCRFAVSTSGDDAMTPSCRLPTAARVVAQGGRCDEDDVGAECEGGGCLRACGEPDRPFCLQERCTRPCVDDADCESPFRCVAFHRERTIDDAPLRHCALSFGTCFDQLDCCRAGEACADGWPTTDGSCALAARPDGGVTSDCVERDPARGDLGASCATDDACASGLCVTPTEGAPFCSSPCVPTEDRCDAILLGTRCEILRGDTPATRVQGCR